MSDDRTDEQNDERLSDLLRLYRTRFPGHTFVLCRLA